MELGVRVRFRGTAGARAVSVLIVLGLAGCGGDDGSADAAATSEPATTIGTTASDPPTREYTAAPVPTTPAVPDNVTAIDVVVSGGVVSPDLGEVAVPLGNTVRLVVTADSVDEIHVHGYDLYLDLAPGVPGELEFVASIPGIFEVELHEGGQLLFELRVE